MYEIWFKAHDGQGWQQHQLPAGMNNPARRQHAWVGVLFGELVRDNPDCSWELAHVGRHVYILGTGRLGKVTRVMRIKAATAAEGETR